jgi:hypothetical protein
VSNWNGPYIGASTLADPWGMSYFFDPDYAPYRNCAGQTEQTTGTTILSFGPNKIGINVYDCDDVFLMIK